MEKQKKFASFELDKVISSFVFDDRLFVLTKNMFKAGRIETYNFNSKRYVMEMVTNDIEAVSSFEIHGIASDSKDQVLITGTGTFQDGTSGLKVFQLTKRSPSEAMNNTGGLSLLYNMQIMNVSAQNRPHLEKYTVNIAGDKAIFYGGTDQHQDIKSTIYSLNLSPNLDELQGVVGGGGGGLFGQRNIAPRHAFAFQQIQQETQNEAPEPRFNHSSVVLNGELYIFGGQAFDDILLNDLWRFDISTRVWTRITQPDFKIPGRAHGLATTDQKKLYFSGGTDKDGLVCNDMIVYNPQSDTIQVYKFEPSSEPIHSLFYYWGKVLTSRGRDVLFSNFESEPFLEVTGSNGKIASKSGQDDLKRFFTEMPFPDITFKVEGQEISGHKALLSIRCPHFGRAFSSNMKESYSDVIEIPDIKADVFKGLLEYLYCGKIPKDENLAIGLFEVSEMYLLPDLRNKCEYFLIQSLSLENTTEIILLAQKYGADKLKIAGLQFLNVNRHKLDDADLNRFDKDLLIEIIKFGK